MLALTIPVRIYKQKEINRSFEEIKYFIFDFDLTLTDKHLYHLLEYDKTTLEDLEKPPFKNERICQEIKNIFNYLKENQKEIYIVSRNYRDVIYHYMTKNIDPDFSIEKIFTDRQCFFSKETEISKYSKWTIFEQLKNRSIEMNRIFYMDDTMEEIEQIREVYPEIQYFHKKEYITMENFKRIFMEN